MSVFFVPYFDDVPATIEVNGHTLLIVASDSDDLQEEMSFIGANEIREFIVEKEEEEIPEVLADLAADIGGGVVLTPPGVRTLDMIDDLVRELPWIH